METRKFEVTLHIEKKFIVEAKDEKMAFGLADIEGNNSGETSREEWMTIREIK